MKIEVEVPEEKMEAVITTKFGHDFRCDEDCEYWQEQLYAILMGWA